METPIHNCLKKNKPDISPSSVKTYTILLKSLFYRHHEKNVPIDCDWYNNDSKILPDITERPLTTQKTILSALIAMCPKNNEYKNKLLQSGSKYQSWIDKQEKSEKQEDNWMPYEEVVKIYNEAYANIKPILSHKGEISQPDFMRFQDFVILALCCGIWFPPRRSADWVNVKLLNVDKSTDNYIEKKRFYFNEYKTKKFYGRQDVAIPAGLKTILDKFISHNPYDYLLVDNFGRQITNVRLGQRLNHMFKSKISTSMLRHIFLSDKLKNIPSLVDLQDTASAMGHSINEALQYVKH